MVEVRKKIIAKSGRKDDLLLAIQKILNHEFQGLDIVPLKNKKGHFRCRVGKIRIIFFVKDGEFYISKVGYRGDVY